jgi:NhaP-type Na+/H+ or K+/H+ antiporter
MMHILEGEALSNDASGLVCTPKRSMGERI